MGDEKIRLTKMSTKGGCAAKWNPSDLLEILSVIDKTPDAALLRGFDKSDDAAVYKLTDDLAAVLTLDFFTPLVDDPYDFGAIAAANAMSDVYAMGGDVKVALNILAVPISLGTETVGRIVKGASDKVKEAGANIAGGHTIEDDEPKFGLSVFGLVDPNRIMTNQGAKAGDLLFYTKTIGTGIMTSAKRAGLIDEKEMRPAIDAMMELNRNASAAMMECDAHAATDVTGFSLAGHLTEMLADSGLSAEIHVGDIPVFDPVLELSEDYCRPGKTFDLIEWLSPSIDASALANDVRNAWMGVICDPQTSGGLLVAIDPAKGDEFVKACESRSGRAPSLIGRFVERPEEKVVLLP